MTQDNLAFKEVTERYLKLLSQRYRQLPRSVEKMFRKMGLNMPVVDITRAHGLQLLLDVLAPVPSEVVTVVCGIFNFAFREGHPLGLELSHRQTHAGSYFISKLAGVRPVTAHTLSSLPP